jgi:hypothetical protein
MGAEPPPRDRGDFDRHRDRRCRFELPPTAPADAEGRPRGKVCLLWQDDVEDLIARGLALRVELAARDATIAALRAELAGLQTERDAAGACDPTRACRRAAVRREIRGMGSASEPAGQGQGQGADCDGR